MSLTPGEARTLPLALSQKLLLAATFPSRSLQKNVSNSPCLFHEVQVSVDVPIFIEMNIIVGLTVPPPQVLFPYPKTVAEKESTIAIKLIENRILVDEDSVVAIFVCISPVSDQRLEQIMTTNVWPCYMKMMTSQSQLSTTNCGNRLTLCITPGIGRSRRNALETDTCAFSRQLGDLSESCHEAPALCIASLTSQRGLLTYYKPPAKAEPGN